MAAVLLDTHAWAWSLAGERRLAGLRGEQGGSVAGFEPSICLKVGIMKRVHRDPFDRLLAATAMHHNLPLISADPVFDGVVTRVW